MTQPKPVATEQFDMVAQFVTANSHVKPKLSVLSPRNKGTYEFTSRGDVIAAIQKAQDGGKNLGMHLSSIVDVDIDVKPTDEMTDFERHMAMSDFRAARFALSRFLPQGVVFGTEARPGSHMFYTYTGDANSLAIVKVAGKARIELRTGEGAHTVMPGSVHPSDGVYHFEPSTDVYSTMPTVEARQLNNAVSLANIFIDVCKEWESPNRNTLAICIAGTFWYANQAAVAVDQEDETPATLQNVEHLIEAILDYREDNDKTRIRSIRATWRKAEKDAQIKSLKQDFPELHDRVMQALRIDAQSREYAKFRDEKITMGVGRTVIDLAQEKEDGSFLTMTFDEFAFDYAAYLVHGKQMSNVLRADTLRHRVTGMVMRPMPLKDGVKLLKRCPPFAPDFIVEDHRPAFDQNGEEVVNTQRYFNLYPGPPFMPVNEEVTYDDVEPGVWFIKESLACGLDARTDEEVAKRTHILFAFIADIVQDPAVMPGIAIVLTGIGGTGKTAYTMLAQAVLRDAMCSPSMALGDFMDDKGGADFQHKLLVCVPESSTKGMQSNVRTVVENKLKSLITENKVRIRAMRVDPDSKYNYARVILNSNHSEHPVPIDANATRRYCVYTPNEKWSERVAEANKQEVMDRWTRTFDWLAKPENKRKLLTFFGNYQYSKDDLRGPHMTPELERLIMERGDTVDEWLLWGVTENNHPAPLSAEGALDWVAKLSPHAFVKHIDGQQTPYPSRVEAKEWPNRVSSDAIYRAYEEWHKHYSRNDKRLAQRYRLTRPEFANKLQSAVVDGKSLLGHAPVSTGLYKKGKRVPYKLYDMADKTVIAKYLLLKYPHSDLLREVIEGVGRELPDTEY